MEINLQNLQKKVPFRAEKIKKLIQRVLKGERVIKTGWINICFVDNPRIKKLNARFLKINEPTDVLAFNLSDKKEKNVILADIIISAPEALKQARYFRTTADYELSLYVVHGILHILGFRDRTLRQIKLMRKKESCYVY
ncbi:MAG: rRNA maturation RNase YbeY [Candidatus Omnitrophota bacterium]